MYHHVLSRESSIASSIDDFEKQMKFLHDNNWKTLTSEEFYLFKTSKIKVPKKSVLITFDDGWRDNFVNAYPILRKYGLKATMFLITQWIEESSKKDDIDYIEATHKECKKQLICNPRLVVCNWKELKQMTDVFDYHAHTHNHNQEIFSSRISWEDNFLFSKILLKEKLNIDTKQLCWPRGEYNKELIEKAKKHFKILYTTKRGVNLQDNKLLEIKRIAVKKDDKWLRKILKIYSSTLLAKIYSFINR